MPRCRSTVSDLRFPQLFLIVAGILIQLRVILHILALTEIFLEAPRLAALIRLWLDVARKALTLEVRVIFFTLIARIIFSYLRPRFSSIDSSSGISVVVSLRS